MTDEEKATYERLVEEAIQTTEAQISELKEATKPISLDNSIGRLSRMDAINNKSISENSLRENEAKLKRLQAIRKTFGTEKLGKCVKCGQEIPYQRLTYLPATRVCVRCSSK